LAGPGEGQRAQQRGCDECQADEGGTLRGADQDRHGPRCLAGAAARCAVAAAGQGRSDNRDPGGRAHPLRGDQRPARGTSLAARHRAEYEVLVRRDNQAVAQPGQGQGRGQLDGADE
jgi:hypothetical protein